MSNYTQEAFNEMFKDRERELLKEKEGQKVGEGRTQQEKQNIKQLLQDYNF
jgi:hypothetical protein